MPFGLYSVPATRQWLIDLIVDADTEDIIFAYLNNLIICTSEFKKH